VEVVIMNMRSLRGGLQATCFGSVVSLLASGDVGAAATQVRDPEQVTLNVTGATVPTTRILAVGRWTSKATAAGVHALLPDEVRATVSLYLDGVIDEWFIQQNNAGVVFLLNVTDAGKAHQLLEKLPLGQAGLMEFQLTALGPISALRALLPTPSK
jgi:hypothetical protein